MRGEKKGRCASPWLRPSCGKPSSCLPGRAEGRLAGLDGLTCGGKGHLPAAAQGGKSVADQTFQSWLWRGECCLHKDENNLFWDKLKQAVGLVQSCEAALARQKGLPAIQRLQAAHKATQGMQCSHAVASPQVLAQPICARQPYQPRISPIPKLALPAALCRWRTRPRAGSAPWLCACPRTPWRAPSSHWQASRSPRPAPTAAGGPRRRVPITWWRTWEAVWRWCWMGGRASGVSNPR